MENVAAEARARELLEDRVIAGFPMPRGSQPYGIAFATANASALVALEATGQYGDGWSTVGPGQVQFSAPPKASTIVPGDTILIATGGRPWLPKDLPGVEVLIHIDPAGHIDEPDKPLVEAYLARRALELHGRDAAHDALFVALEDVNTAAELATALVNTSSSSPMKGLAFRMSASL